MPAISAALEIAIAHHQAGRLDLAAEIYRRVLAAEPSHPDALHLTGLIAHQLGRNEEAVDYMRRAIALEPRAAEYHNNLGEAYRVVGKLVDAAACFRRALELKPDLARLHANLANVLLGLGRLDEAGASYQRSLELEPGFAEAQRGLGNVWQAQGKLDQAIACYRQALQFKPDYAKAYNDLGIVLRWQDKLSEAAACYQRAIELMPDFAEAYSNLGNAWQDQGNLDEAIACCHRALRLKPNFAEAHNNLANALQGQGKLQASIPCYQRAIELKPDFAEAYSNLGNAWQNLGKLDEAVACYRRALELRPNHAKSQNDLGATLRRQGHLLEAAACYRRAMELQPDLVEAHNNLGTALKDLGRPDEAIACYRRALELKPAFAMAHSNLLLTLQYRDGVTRLELAVAHAEYERLHAAPLRSTWRAHDNADDPDRPLRLGFVSFDLARHPVGQFLVRVIEGFDRTQCQAVCYSGRPVPDAITARCQAAAFLWRDVFGLPDGQLADQIRADRIDILFDLAGHTAHNRLLVFARKPAPIQITWAGYVGTTGLSAIDYILADRYHIPPEAEPDYCEQVLRMPQGYVTFDPPAEAPPVGPLPALSSGRITFGSFNNLAKITPRVVAVWSKILHRLPQSRLLLKCAGAEDEEPRRRLAEWFAAQAVDADRLDLSGRSSQAQLLADYSRVDVALDPFPYSGGLTTCEALWMGVPVITCPGETFASRHSLSHLSNVGLRATVAASCEEYVELAVGLAGDLPRLAEIRTGLRQRVAASPLCDGQGFAADLMQLLRGVWRDWCRH